MEHLVNFARMTFPSPDSPIAVGSLTGATLWHTEPLLVLSFEGLDIKSSGYGEGEKYLLLVKPGFEPWTSRFRVHSLP